jgi:hypothetical protein
LVSECIDEILDSYYAFTGDLEPKLAGFLGGETVSDGVGSLDRRQYNLLVTTSLAVWVDVFSAYVRMDDLTYLPQHRSKLIQNLSLPRVGKYSVLALY